VRGGKAEPRVSVLLPVRDAAEFLGLAVDAVLRQTLSELELVVVDDGSLDASPDIVIERGQRDPRVRLLRCPGSGLVAALNAGLQACRAPAVARMDADDVCHPRRLEEQLRHLDRHPEVGVVSCQVRLFPRSRLAGGYRVYEDWLNRLSTHDAMARERFVEAPLVHPTAMVRRHLLEEAGGYRDLGWPEDYDLWLRLFAADVRFAKLDRPLYFWREHSERLTRSDPRYTTDAFLRCKAHHLLEGPLAASPPLVVWGAGQTGRKLSRLLIAGGAAVEAFVDIDPGKIGGTVRDRPVVGPEELPSLLRRQPVVLVAVASRGARALIRHRLVGLGLVEGHDFWCVA